MALREEFEKSGTWLFRRRSYLPLILLLLVFSQLPGSSPIGGTRASARLWDALCLALAVIGLAIRVHVVGHAPGGTSGRTTGLPGASALNTSGFYSVVRHPLYLGNALMWLGVALLVHNWWLEVVIALCFWLYYERIMFAEEELLRARFGSEFEVWASRTPAFIPRFRQWRRPELSFSLRTVLGREHAPFFAMIAAFFVLVVARERVQGGTWDIDPVWSATFALSLLVYLVLRSLKLYTHVLDVPGR